MAHIDGAKLRAWALEGNLEGIKSEIGNISLYVLHETSPEEPQDAALHCACRNGHFEVVKALVEAGADVEQRGGRGRVATPFMIACQNGHMQVVRYLVQQGCDIHAAERGCTGLHTAAQNNHIDVVRFLVGECGANADLSEADGTTAFGRACSMVATEVVEYLAFCDTCDPNHLDVNGRSPLFWACTALEGNLSLVRFLITRVGCDVNTRDHLHMTPLFQAAGKGNDAVVAELLHHGAAFTPTVSQICPLQVASQRGFLGVVKLLASVPQARPYLTPALEAALDTGHLLVAHALVRAGAVCPAPNKGEIGTIHASCRNYVEFLRVVQDTSVPWPMWYFTRQRALQMSPHLTSLGIDRLMDYERLAYNQLTSMLMGKHPRLGQASAISALPHDVLQLICTLVLSPPADWGPSLLLLSYSDL
eukprot:c17188_g1_i1.p1 GENE.c17188_g1_i1~~c17188_g1_i1.p1  ORF type:complete len:430 (-),score=63.55 c17188_g1_i1:264-1523(-)